METLKSILPYIGRFLIWLTPLKLLTVTFFCIVLIVSITLFEQRNVILNSISKDRGLALPSPPNIKIPETLQATVEEYVSNNKKLVFFSIVSSNIRVNQSETVYFFSDDGRMNQLHADALRNSGSVFPIFTSSQTENTQMIAAINGEFACYKYEETFKNRSAPDGSDISPFICTISLPPYYGEFSGFLLFGLKSAPTATDIDEFRLAGTRFSTEIYSKNFKRKNVQ